MSDVKLWMPNKLAIEVEDLLPDSTVMDHCLLAVPRDPERILVNPQCHQRLSAELDWYTRVLARLVPATSVLTQPIIHRAVIEALMSVGMVVSDRVGTDAILRFDASYERHGVVAVMLFSVLEVVDLDLREGHGIEQSLDEAMEPAGWRPLEPLSTELRPLVRKAQRLFPVTLIRKMPPDLFWFLAMPRLVEANFINSVPREAAHRA